MCRSLVKGFSRSLLLFATCLAPATHAATPSTPPRQIIVNATITVAVAILLETSLSFLGLGVKPPDTSLGKLISDNQQAARTRPWLFYFPAIALVLLTVSMALVADGLRDALDPTSAAGGRA